MARRIDGKTIGLIRKLLDGHRLAKGYKLVKRTRTARKRRRRR